MGTVRIVEIIYDEDKGDIEDFFLTDAFMLMSEEDKAEAISKIADHFTLLSLDSVLSDSKGF